MLKLELGKYYKDRDGKVWGPLTRTPPKRNFACTHPFHAGGRAFRKDGSYGMQKGKIAPEDLVEEWQPEPPAKPSPAPTAASSSRVARYFVISREGLVSSYTSLRAAQKAARGFAIAAPGRAYSIAVFAETISSKER